MGKTFRGANKKLRERFKNGRKTRQEKRSINEWEPRSDKKTSKV